VVVMAGQGAVASAASLTTFLARRPALVMTTVSARGVVPESDPWSLAYDFLACSVAETNRLLEEADLVLLLGCRTSHNGTGGFGLRLPAACTVHVDLDPAVLGANYAVRWPVRSSVASFLDGALAALGPEVAGSAWTPADAAHWRRSLREKSLPIPAEPTFPGVAGGEAGSFFAAFQGTLPAGAVVVTDTGQHQIMARTHLRVDTPRGLLVPADYQSMGFGLPAAIGAALALPGRRVVAILGDGGLMMSGLELATAARERVDLTAVVFNDGQLGQIRAQQWSCGAGESAVSIAGLDFEALAAATGARYLRVEDDAAAVLSQAHEMRGVVLVDVPLDDSLAMRRARWSGALRGTARRAMGQRGGELVRRLLRRS
jgi:acetolactate synthase-1/2/3 large subunit